MKTSGIAGAVLAPSNCAECQHQWNCEDRRTHEIVGAVAQNPEQLRGLATYDSLRIGESLRWIDDAVTRNGLTGAYVQAEGCASGLDAPRMYPLYGLCAKLRAPLVIHFSTHERWLLNRPHVEVLAADFPDLDILLATPPRTNTASILSLMKRFPRISFLICPQELRSDPALCEYIELQGRNQALFRSTAEGWPQAVEMAKTLPLGPTALSAYLFENAAKLFNFAIHSGKLTQ
jgi:predicted TIM-barrel fold metal-dependent hydrolase